MGRIEQVEAVKPKWKVQVVPIPREDAERELDAALDLLADALAEQLIEEARAEVAAGLGQTPHSIDREHSRETSRAVADCGLPAFEETR